MVSQGGHFGASSCRQTDNPRGCDQTQDQNSLASQSAVAQVDQKESNGQQYGDRRRPDEMQSAARLFDTQDVCGDKTGDQAVGPPHSGP